eukprot:scaffold63487_cov17-Prasinocladus_malaysianus.AAC.1
MLRGFSIDTRTNNRYTVSDRLRDKKPRLRCCFERRPAPINHIESVEISTRSIQHCFVAALSLPLSRRPKHIALAHRTFLAAAAMSCLAHAQQCLTDT